jgi:hypothetical protein
MVRQKVKVVSRDIFLLAFDYRIFVLFLIPLVEYVAPLWVVNSVELGFYLLLTIIYFLIALRVLPILSKKYKDL